MPTRTLVNECPDRAQSVLNEALIEFRGGVCINIYKVVEEDGQKYQINIENTMFNGVVSEVVRVFRVEDERLATYRILTSSFMQTIQHWYLHPREDLPDVEVIYSFFPDK